MYSEYDEYDDYISHHGVKGQRWGVRRYQNKDGSLTAEGYQHWGLNPDGSKFKGKRRKDYTDSTAQTAKKVAIGSMAAGGALGFAAGGPVGAVIGAHAGMIVGGPTGAIAGAVKTRRMQKKIRRILDENGVVYVKDL